MHYRHNILQTILFDKSKWTKMQAIEWLVKHNYKHTKVDVTTDKLRFRQHEPNDELEYYTVKLINGIDLVYMKQMKSKPSHLFGGAMSIKDLQEHLKQSYEKRRSKVLPSENGDYHLDETLSTQEQSVYHNPKTGHTVLTHRGTSGAKDWLNNAAHAVGLSRATSRFKRARKVQRETEKKYGTENLSTLGHSQGSLLSHKLGQKSTEIINYNPYTFSKHKNEYVVRNKYDPVSLAHLTASKKDKRNYVVDNSFEHRLNGLDNTDKNIEIGIK